jgi:hypothetical protein
MRRLEFIELGRRAAARVQVPSQQNKDHKVATVCNSFAPADGMRNFHVGPCRKHIGYIGLTIKGWHQHTMK